MVRRLLIAFLAAVLPTTCLAAQESGSSSNARRMLRARLAEEAKADGKAPAVPTAEPPKSETAKALAEGTAGKDESLTLAPAPAPSKTESASDVRKQPATVMPPVEVRKHRITELDQQLAQQDKQIAREKEIAKPTDLDKALNDSKIAKPLAIFGGESTQFRQQVSQQRVNLMEDEKDLLEAIAQAKTKAEKAELKKQLKELRAQRRELERALR